MPNRADKTPQNQLCHDAKFAIPLALEVVIRTTYGANSDRKVGLFMTLSSYCLYWGLNSMAEPICRQQKASRLLRLYKIFKLILLNEKI